MTVNTTAIKSFLEPGLNAIFGDYPMYPAQWREIFTTYPSDKAVEKDVEVKLLGLAQLKAEGASTNYDDMGERYTTSYVNRYVSTGFIITRQAIKDNQYKSAFPMQAKALKNAFGQAKETLGAAVLNNGFDGTNYPIGDSEALFSTAHPIDGNTVANRPTADVDLNETTMEAAMISIQGFRDQAGLRMMAQPRKLVVARDNQFIAARLLRGDWQMDSANRNINALKNMNMIPEGFVVNQFLTDADAWFVLTNADNGFKHFQREAFETDMYTDFDNDNLKVKGIERYSFGVSNFRAAFGTSGA